MSIEGRRRLAGLHPDVRAAADWALSWADFYDVPITVTSGIRTWADQNRLYQKHLWCLDHGLSGTPGDCRFPANRPGDSSHQFGLSWDSWTPEYSMPWWIEVRRLAGFEVLPNDLIHAQVPGWRNFV